MQDFLLNGWAYTPRNSPRKCHDTPVHGHRQTQWPDCQSCSAQTSKESHLGCLAGRGEPVRISRAAIQEDWALLLGPMERPGSLRREP